MKSIVDLPRSRDLPKSATKATLAALLYPGMEFDTWLPEWWFEGMLAEVFRMDLSLNCLFIWGYPSGRASVGDVTGGVSANVTGQVNLSGRNPLFGNDRGMPLPLTEEAGRLLERMPPDLRLEERAGGMENPWHGRPPAEEYVPNHMTKDQLAKLVYPDITFDTALPQEWVNAKTLVCQGWDPRPCVVWGYPSKADAPPKADATASALPTGLPGGIFGGPMPLTAEAEQRLEEDGR